jgi:hypothetical protein
VAVRSVVGALKTDKPSRFISESEVRKILGRERPRDAKSILIFKRKKPKNLSRVLQLLAMAPGYKALQAGPPRPVGLGRQS